MASDTLQTSFNRLPLANKVFNQTLRSGNYQQSGKFETEHFDQQLSSDWHAFSSFHGGQGDVFFDDGERKIDMIIAFDDSIDFDPAR